MVSYQFLLCYYIVFKVGCLVHGCSDYFYGEDCRGYCSPTCYSYSGSRRCDEVTGACFACHPGVQGVFCEEKCPERSFGVNCNQECDANCLNQMCDHVAGTCDDCIDGRDGLFCEKDITWISEGPGFDDTEIIILSTVFSVAFITVVLSIFIYSHSKKKTKMTTVIPTISILDDRINESVPDPTCRSSVGEDDDGFERAITMLYEEDVDNEGSTPGNIPDTPRVLVLNSFQKRLSFSGSSMSA